MMPNTDVMRSAQSYWNLAANTYEQDFTGTVIGQTRRSAVWRELMRNFRPGERILEINCGTGIDAVYLAERGVRVLACDISPRMIELAQERVVAAGYSDSVSLRVLATEEIAALRKEGPFDGAFSNFSGLNCVEDLTSVAKDLSRLVKPGGRTIFSLMGRFVPWEMAWFLGHGDIARAFRRLKSFNTFTVENKELRVRHLSVKEVARQFQPAFRLRNWKGVGITVPPSFLENWAQRVPRLIRTLAEFDRMLERIPMMRNMADCMVMEFERTESCGAAK